MAVAPTKIEFQDTSNLEFGGAWVSSDFYSHSGGYRLCLVLKSTKIDQPTNERRIVKPTQQVAVIAIDDGTDRKWPCEGTATMRFEIPRNEHLRGEPLNPPFVVNFSIGEPSTNIQLRVKFEGNLPPDFVRSWTSIPQECVPFYLEYSPPSIFDRNKPLFQQHAAILTNNASNIIVKIEDVKMALKGVKRALDLSPPEKRKKLELDSQLNEPTFLSGVTDTAEYQTMVSHTEELTISVKHTLIMLSGALLASGLISMDNYSEFSNIRIAEADRAARLVGLVQQKVKLNPQNYFKFIATLEEDSDYYNPILRLLRETYRSKEAVGTLQDVAAQAGLKQLDILDQECSQQVLLSLAKHCVEWKLIGFHLELTKADIVAVDEEYRTVDEKRIGMLRKWKAIWAFKATYRVFIEALLSCGKASDAIEACKTIASSINVPVEGEITFSSSMSELDFVKWLKSGGIRDGDCKVLSENGVTASGLIMLDAEDFDDLGLTRIGKKLILKRLVEAKKDRSSDIVTAPFGHILTKDERDVLATLLGDEKFNAIKTFIEEKQGRDIRREEIERLLTRHGFTSLANSLEDDLKKGVENMEHYAAYQQALQDGFRPLLSYLKFLFLGPPRSGKSSMRQRLLQEIVNLIEDGILSISTNIAETNDVVIKELSSETAAILGPRWKSMKQEKQGTPVAVHSKGALKSDYVVQLFYQFIRKKATSATGQEPVQHDDRHSEVHVLMDTQDKNHENSDLESQHDTQSENCEMRDSETNVAKRLTKSEETEILDTFEKLTTILQSDSPEELKQLLEDLIMINMMDVGGQPAFLDMLPALTIGPALYLLFFRLDQDFKTCYPVRYLPADGSSEITLKSSYTIEEVLFRSLASIACFSCSSLEPSASIPQESSGAKSESHSQARSRALLIGTYKDEAIKIDNRIPQMEQMLKGIFTRTELYRKGVLLKTPEDKMMFTVDNMKGTEESEMSHIRKDIEKIIKQNFPPVPIPASWLMFRMVLGLLKKRVVSLAQCEEIAGKLSTPTPVEEAIWFFHHNIGSLMHYPDILSMKDTVICDPQVIFDCISTLIIDKFKHENRALGPYEVDEFYQKGQFSLSHIKDTTGQHNCPLRLDQLMDLLKHHNVVAEITHDQHSEQKFIMPAVLMFASKEELDRPISGSSEHQSIMIHFDGGFVPFGVFSTCMARLIAHKDSTKPKWQLHICEENQEFIRRNKVTFRVYGAFYATIIARPQYLEITVSHRPRGRCKNTLPEICSAVRQTVTETLRTVISKMKYKPFGTLQSSIEQPFDLAFRCCLEDDHSDHLMKVIEDDDERYAMCLKEKGMEVDLDEKKHCIWFDMNENKMRCETSTSSSNTDSSSVTANATPDLLTINDLLAVQNATWSARSKGYNIGLGLGIQPGTLDAIWNDDRRCDQQYTDILKHWLRRSDPKPTWGALADALRSPSVEESALADQLPPRTSQE